MFPAPQLAVLGAVALLLFFIAAIGLRLGVRQPDGGRSAQLGRLFAGGVLLSAATVHMLADAVETLAEVTEFPLGLFCLGGGYLITVGVESWARAAASARRLAPTPNDGNADAADGNVDAADGNGDATVKAAASCALLPILSRLAKAANKVTLVGALTLHSFVAGPHIYRRASAPSLSTRVHELAFLKRAAARPQASQSARSSRCNS